MEIKNLKLKALIQKYEAQKSAALVNMEVYLSNSVGIGEHADIIGAMSEILDQYDSAKGKLESLYEIANIKK